MPQPGDRTLVEVSGIKDAGLFMSGLRLSSQAEEVPIWADGKNIVFRNNEIQKQGGYVSQATASESITEIEQANIGTTPRIYAGSATKLHKYDVAGGISVIGTGFTSADWSFVPFGTWLLATNGVDPSQVWKNTGSAAALAGTTFSWAKLFAKRGPFVIAIDTSNGNDWVEWSDDDAPETWAPLSSNRAGNLQVRDLDSEFVARCYLGDSIALYTSGQLHIMDFTGGDFVFSINLALTGIGAVSKRSVVAVGRLNFGLSRNGIWWTDGTNFNYLDDPMVNQWLQDNVNWAYGSTVRAVHLASKNLVLFYIPTGANTVPNCGVGYNYVNKSFTYTDIVPSACAPKLVFDYPIFGFGTKLAFADKTVNADGAALPFYIQTKPMDCGDREIYKRLQAVRLRLKDAVGLTLSMGVSDNADDAPTWFYSGAAAEINNFLDREGVFLHLKLEGTTIDSNMRLSGFKLLGEPGAFVQ